MSSSSRTKRFTYRDHGASILVAALSSAFGVGLLQATAYLGQLFGSSGGAISAAMTVLAVVFTGISIYVGAVVTANTFATIVAGRIRVIALQRLIGADAARLRRSVSGEGALAGLIGSVIGALVGIGLASALLAIGREAGIMPDARYPIVAGTIWLPMVAVVVTTWAASRVGSRRVLNVSPIQAISSARSEGAEASGRHTVRDVFSVLLLSVGAIELAIGVLIGLLSPLGMFVAMIGGFTSFAGVVVGAYRIMPGLLKLVGRTLGGSVPARLAASNAVRYPQRSARTTIGLVIGVTLITTFAVAGSTYRDMVLGTAMTLQQRATIDQVLAITLGVMIALIGFSAVIAAVGMVNNLSLSVLQRTREIGLLRALGLTAAQVRRMILAESVQMSVTSIGFGLVIGIVYGWAGAQSLMASLVRTGLVVPTVPWQLLLGVAAGAVVLAVAASILPSRRATTISPVTALAVD